MKITDLNSTDLRIIEDALAMRSISAKEKAATLVAAGEPGLANRFLGIADRADEVLKKIEEIEL